MCKEEVRDGIREEVGYYKDTSAYKKAELYRVFIKNYLELSFAAFKFDLMR